MALSWKYQTTFYISVFDCFLDVGFVIDESRSINEQEWITVLNFVKMIAAAIRLSPTEGHAAVVAFDHDSRHPITFNQFQTLRLMFETK